MNLNSTSIEFNLPLTAPLSMALRGVLSPRRQAWVKRQPSSASLGGKLLMSHRQLRVSVGSQTTSILLDEPFRVHLSRWEGSRHLSTVELGVTVSQGTNRIAFCVELPGGVVPSELPERELIAPYLPAEDFRRLWPALRHFAQLHGHARLASFEITSESTRPAARPTSLRVTERGASTWITPVLDAELWFQGLILTGILSVMGGFLLILSLIVVVIFFELRLSDCLAMSPGNLLILFVLVSAPFASFYAFRDVRHGLLSVFGVGEVQLSSDTLRVRRSLFSNVAIPLKRVDQLYVREWSGRMALWCSLRAEEGGASLEQTLLFDALYEDEARFLESFLERKLSIEDRPVYGEVSKRG